MLVSPPQTDSPVRRLPAMEQPVLRGWVMTAFGVAFTLAGLTVRDSLLPLTMVVLGLLLTVAGIALARRQSRG